MRPFFEWLLKALETSGLFSRNRFSLETKLKAVLLYLAGLSYRDVTYVLGFVPCSHEAVRLWVKKIEQFTLNVAAKERRLVALDETKLKVNGQCCFIWAAIDVDTRELLAIYVSWQRSILDSETFLRKLLLACTNKPVILADKGPWYPDAFETYKIEWVHQTFGQRNRIERWFRTLKHRTKRFYNNFPAKNNQILNIKLFLKLFTIYYNFIRPHQTLKHPPATPTT